MSEPLTAQDREAILYNAYAPLLHGIELILPEAIDRYEATCVQLEQRVAELERQLVVRTAEWYKAIEMGNEHVADARRKLLNSLPITPEQVSQADALIEQHAPAADSTTSVQVALSDLKLWIESGGKYPRKL